MPQRIPELKALQCKNLKYDPDIKKNNYLRDGRGLILEALANDRKVWNYEFRIHGKKSQLRFPHDFTSDKGTLGTLEKAREWRQQQRQLVKAGISPTLYARQQKDEQARKQAEEARQLSSACPKTVVLNEYSRRGFFGTSERCHLSSKWGEYSQCTPKFPSVTNLQSRSDVDLPGASRTFCPTHLSLLPMLS